MPENTKIERYQEGDLNQDLTNLGDKPRELMIKIIDDVQKNESLPLREKWKIRKELIVQYRSATLTQLSEINRFAQEDAKIRTQAAISNLQSLYLPFIGMLGGSNALKLQEILKQFNITITKMYHGAEEADMLPDMKQKYLQGLTITAGKYAVKIENLIDQCIEPPDQK